MYGVNKMINPIYLKDAYKVDHYRQYPPNTTLIFSNFTPRKSRMPGVNHSVFFGLQYFLREYLQNAFHDSYFFSNPELVESTYGNMVKRILGVKKEHKHMRDLSRNKHLPLAIYALPEGTVVPCGVPALVMFNTKPEFYWLTNMLETIMSCTLWGACTSATIAREYRLLLDNYAHLTSDIPEFVDYQAHDFSMRGMFGLEAAMISGAAHLQYFKGTDTIPAMVFAGQYYDMPMHVCSVPATEHSVMSAGGKDKEYETYERLITQVYPEGIVSIVSDTWDLWNVVSTILPKLKSRILARSGKLVIRPDSGDPVEILCGWCPYKNVHRYPLFPTYETKGLIECLWDIFGGTINSKGYKQLDPHIGAIYGDSITLERCKEICERLKQKGFASTNIVFGIGSYTYQHNTRDTLGWAMKATYAEIDGVGRAIIKDPITDDGTKKSHSGLLRVLRGTNDELICQQNCTWDEFYAPENELKLVYKDGIIQ